MADKYVAPAASGGSNSNPGTLASPYLTIRKGIENTVAANGDTVWIRGGTYVETISTEVYTIPSGTSFANALTVQAYTGETVILAPSTSFAIRITGNTRYVIFKNFIIDCTSGTEDGVSIGDNDAVNIPGYIRFENMEVKNAGVAHKNNFLIWCGSGAIGLGHNEFINCNVHHGGSAPFGHGLYITVPNCLIDGGTYHDNAAFGITVYANAGFPLEQTHNTIIRNVTAYNNVDGIGCTGGNASLVQNCIAYNNSNDGIQLKYGQPATGCQILNCAAYNNGGYGLRVGADHTTDVVKNCLGYGNGSGQFLDEGIGTVTGNNRTTDPSWVDAATGDFHLQAGSPCIDAGLNLSSIFTTDIEGHTRPIGAAWDQGPYEYGSIGPATGNARRLIASDPFSGGALVALAGNWQQLYPSIVLMYKDASGYLTSSPNSTTVNGAARWVANAFAPDQYSSLELRNLHDTSSGASFIGVCLRASGDIDGARDMYWLAIYSLSGVTHTDLGKDVNGTITFLVGRTDIVWSASDRMELEAVGPSIIALKSGSVLFTVTDSDLPSGAPGVIGAGTFDSLGDNWEGGNLNDPDTSVPAHKGRRLIFMKVGY